MNQLVQNTAKLDVARSSVEIVVHISESLEDSERNNLVAVLEKEDSIISAEFCPLRYHLMLVKYDKDLYSSKDVLVAVSAQKIHAKLIGPI